MIHATPGSLYVAFVVPVAGSKAFVLAYPVGDGPVDTDTGVVFTVEGDRATPIRIFRVEITSIGWNGDHLLCADGYSGAYVFSAGTWRDYPDAGDEIPRVNALRTVRGEILGICYDGVIARWRGDQWQTVTDPSEDLYVYDLAADDTGRLLVAGEAGLLGTVDGRRIRAVQTGTNLDLTSVLPIGGERLVATGWKGTVMTGTLQALVRVPADDETLAFLNAVLWNDRTLIAASTRILELGDGGLSVFDPEPALRIATDGTDLWKQVDRGVHRRVGTSWTEVPLSVDIP